MAQNTREIVRPKTRRRPLDVSTGILVKGKQKIGSRTIINDKDIKESLSKIFERMDFIILYANKEIQLQNDVDKSIFHINHLPNILT